MIGDIMINDIEKILVTREEIEKRTGEIAEEISKDHNGEEVVLIGLLKGSIYFLCDISRKIKENVTIDFLSASSYVGTKSSGNVVIDKDIKVSIEGKNVVIVEDIIDTGKTMSAVKEILMKKKPKQIKICTLLDKEEGRETEIKADYVGFKVPNEFVVGYGLDYEQKYRNFPEIGVLKREIYEN